MITANYRHKTATISIRVVIILTILCLAILATRYLWLSVVLVASMGISTQGSVRELTLGLIVFSLYFMAIIWLKKKESALVADISQQPYHAFLKTVVISVICLIAGLLLFLPQIAIY